jgi:tight adherence protein B
MDLMLSGAIFVVLFVSGEMSFRRLAARWRDEQEVTKRLEQAREIDIDRDVSVTRIVKRADGELVKRLSGFGLVHKLTRMMLQAGIYMRVSEILLIAMIAVMAGAIAGQLILGDRLLGTLCGIGTGTIPFLYIAWRKKRRLRAINQQLPHVLDLIKSSLDAGHTLSRAFQVVVAEFEPPIASEIRIVIEQNRMGLPISRALEEMCDRVPDEDMRLFAIAVKVQSDVGSSMAQIISRLSEIVRIRQRLEMQVRTLTSQARLSGIIVGLLPVIVLILFTLIRPGYLSDLIGDPAGILILKTAFGLDILALVFIRKLLKVSY